MELQLTRGVRHMGNLTKKNGYSGYCILRQLCKDNLVWVQQKEET